MTVRSIRYPLAGAFLWVAIAGLGNTALAAPPAPSCVCRYAGKEYSVGQSVCIVTSAGPRRAYCGFVLNNTAWKFSSGSCGIASRNTPSRPNAGATPASNVDREITAVLALR